MRWSLTAFFLRSVVHCCCWLRCPGDNDPIDVLDIGARQLRTGEIVAVKILGVLALIDDGETDWKVLAICISDAMAHQLNDIDDVETHLPGTINAIREYFRSYKSFSGKINSYALRAQAMPKQYAVKVVEDTHQHWQSLHIVNKRDVVSKGQTLVQPVAQGGEVPVSTEHLAVKTTVAQAAPTDTVKASAVVPTQTVGAELRENKSQ